MNRHTFLIVAVVFSLFPFACAPVCKTTRSAPSPQASRLLAALKRLNNELESFRGIGKLRITGKGRGQTSRIVWIGSRPQKLRVEALGAQGEPTLTLLVNGSSFHLYSYHDNRCYKGRATAKNMSRFISIPVRAEVIFSLLSGRVPLLPFRDAKAQALKGEGRWRLCLYKKWRRPVEKLWLKDDGRTPERLQVFDGWGDEKYTIEFSRFEQVEGFRIPHEIIISHVRGLVLSLSVDRFWTQVAIPAGAYTLELSDVEVVDLDS